MKRPHPTTSTELHDTNERSNPDFFKAKLSGSLENEKLIALTMIPFLLDTNPSFSYINAFLPSNFSEIILNLFISKRIELEAKKLSFGNDTCAEKIKFVDLSILIESLLSCSALLLVNGMFPTKAESMDIIAFIDESKKIIELLLSIKDTSQNSCFFISEWISFHLSLFKMLSHTQNALLMTINGHFKNNAVNIKELLIFLLNEVDNDLQLCSVSLLLHLVVFCSRNHITLHIDELDSIVHFDLVKAFHNCVMSLQSNSCELVVESFKSFLSINKQKVSDLVYDPSMLCINTSQNCIYFLLDVLELLFAELISKSVECTFEDATCMKDDDTSSTEGDNEFACEDEYLDDVEESLLDKQLSSMEVSLQDLSVAVKKISIENNSNEFISRIFQETNFCTQEILQMIYFKLSQLHSTEIESENLSLSFTETLKKLLSITELYSKYSPVDNFLTTVSSDLIKLEEWERELIMSLFNIALNCNSEMFCKVVLEVFEKSISKLSLDSSSTTTAITLFDFLAQLISRFESGPIVKQGALFLTKFLVFIILYHDFDVQKSSSNNIELVLYTLDIIYDTIGSDPILNILKGDNTFKISTNLIVPLEQVLASLKTIAISSKFKKIISSKQLYEQLKVTLINLKRFISYLSQNQ